METNASSLVKVKIIRILTDYILLNSCSVSSSGLYNGKAGIALTLFEVSRYMKDEYIEEQAFELIKEALLSKNEDIGFENGLTGIGYVLIHLLEDKFLDGDFEELFGDNLNKIFFQLSELEKRTLNKRLLLSHIKIVYFLSALEKYKNLKKANYFIRFFSKNVDIELEGIIAILEKTQDGGAKDAFLYFFESYLNIALSCDSFSISSKVINDYLNLYLKNKIVCNFSIGYYLKQIAIKYNDNELEEIAEQNILLARKNIHPTVLSLSQRIDLLYLLHQHRKDHAWQICMLEKDFFDNEDEILLEKNLIQYISSNNFIAGYQSGISRYLLYWVFKNSNRQENIPFL